MGERRKCAECGGALKTAGAGPVAVLVIGRHVQESYKNNAARLKALPRTFDWTACALHDAAELPT